MPDAVRSKKPQAFTRCGPIRVRKLNAYEDTLPR